MLDTQFKKETFKQSVEENVKKLYRKTSLLRSQRRDHG